MTTNTVSLAILLALRKPAHWPRSSFYCVRTALRRLSSMLSPDESFPVGDLPKIVDLLISEGADPRLQVWSLLTYRSRILRLAAEYVCGHPLRPWEARWFFERLVATCNAAARKEALDESASTRW